MGKFSAPVSEHLILPAEVSQTRGQERIFRLAGRVVPAPVPVRLLIDTGSKRTALVPGIMDHLQSPVANKARIETSLAAGETALCWVRLEFPGTSLAAVPVLAVARLTMPPPLRLFQGVIGRDLLQQWESFLFEGRRGRFTIRDTPGGLLSWLWR
jgi:hypothetical protein